jgi:BirA family biotin operon repressor/biotin-[acetyl-CoA-carboxylase] ligase
MTKSFHAKYIGKINHYFETIDSTNNYAQILISNSSPKEGTVISAGFQVAGKGQYGRNWQGAAKINIYMSVILRPCFLNIGQQFILNKAIAVGVSAAIQHFIDNKVTIKWPNDLYVNDSKIGGILIQNTVQGSAIINSIIGIGINVNQTEFDYLPNPTSLKLEKQSDFELQKVQDTICYLLEHWYDELKSENYTTIINAYNNQLYGLGKPSTFITKTIQNNKQFITGTILSVDDFGRILIDHHGATKAYNHNEISMIVTPHQS